MNMRELFYPPDKAFSKTEDRAYAKEALVYNVTEDILVILEDMNISKKELARRLGKSPSFVTQVLSGARNMTLGTLSDICFAVGMKPDISITQVSQCTTLPHEATRVVDHETPPVGRTRSA